MRLKEELKRFFVYAGGTISSSALNILLIPLYLSVFTAAEYGAVSILLLFVTFSSLFIGAGMMSVVQKKYFDVEGEERRSVLGTVICWYGVSLLVVIVPVVFARHAISAAFFRTQDYAHAVMLTPVLVLLTLLSDIPMSILRIERRPIPFTVLSLIRLLVDAGLKFLLIVGLRRGVAGYLEASIIALTAANVAGYTLIRGTVGFRFRAGIFRSLLRVSSPFIVTGFAIWSLESVDRILLNFLVSESATGVYSVAARFAQAYNILFYAPLSALLPAVLFPLIRDRDAAEVQAAFRRLMNGLVLFGSVVSAVVVFAGVGGIDLLSGMMRIDPTYRQARTVVPFLVSCSFLYSMTIPAGYTALHLGKTELLSISGFAAAGLNLLLNFLLIPVFGVVGAGVSTSSSYLVYALLSYHLLGRRLPTDYRWSRIGVHLALWLALVIGGNQVSFGGPVLSAVIKCIVAVVVLFVVGHKVTRLLDPAIVGYVRAKLIGRRNRVAGRAVARLYGALSSGLWRAGRVAKAVAMHVLKKETEEWSLRGVESAHTYWGNRSDPTNRYLYGRLMCFHPGSVLEIGSNCGNRLFQLAVENPGVRCIGIDVNGAAVTYGRERFREEGLVNVDLRVLDLRGLATLAEKSVDVVFSWATLIYIGSKEIEMVLRSVCRVARKGVVLIEMDDPSLRGGRRIRGVMVPPGNWKRNYPKLFGRLGFDKSAVTREVVPESVWLPGGGCAAAVTLRLDGL